MLEIFDGCVNIYLTPKGQNVELELTKSILYCYDLLIDPLIWDIPGIPIEPEDLF